MKGIVTVAIALLVAMLAAPVWSQTATQTQFAGEVAELAWRYAEQQLGDIGPQEKAQAQRQLTEEVARMAQEMRRLGYGEPETAQALMRAVREAVQTRLASGVGDGTGVALQLRSQLQQQLHLMQRAGVRDQDQIRDQDRTNRPEVAGPPGGGPGGPGGGGKP